MVSIGEVRAAVEKARKLLSDYGIDLDVSAEQFWQWFETDLPVPDIELGDVIIDPLLVVHELVEIDEVLKTGLAITKDVILQNPEKVDDAHIMAVKVELTIARAMGATEHLENRIRDIEQWCLDKTITNKRRAEYEQLLDEAKKHLERLAP